MNEATDKECQAPYSIQGSRSNCIHNPSSLMHRAGGGQKNPLVRFSQRVKEHDIRRVWHDAPAFFRRPRG